MNFSSKIKKFCDGMIVYDHLLEDEGAIHIPFALSFHVTITTIVGQLKQFLIDLKNHVCHEIPDINIEHMGVDKIMLLLGSGPCDIRNSSRLWLFLDIFCIITLVYIIFVRLWGKKI